MASSLEQLSSRVMASSMGQSAEGASNILLTDTTALTSLDPPVVCIEAFGADATFTTLTGNVTKNGVSTAAVGADFGTLEDGRRLYGKFTDITLASGTVMLYR